MTTKKKTRARRETSDRVSRIAAQVMQRLKGLPAKMELASNDWESPLSWVTVGEVRALAGSALSQDQTPGKRAPKKRKAKGRGK
jgi:hypothetical protein